MESASILTRKLSRRRATSIDGRPSFGRRSSRTDASVDGAGVLHGVNPPPKTIGGFLAPPTSGLGDRRPSCESIASHASIFEIFPDLFKEAEPEADSGVGEGESTAEEAAEAEAEAALESEADKRKDSTTSKDEYSRFSVFLIPDSSAASRRGIDGSDRRHSSPWRRRFESGESFSGVEKSSLGGRVEEEEEDENNDGDDDDDNVLNNDDNNNNDADVFSHKLGFWSEIRINDQLRSDFDRSDGRSDGQTDGGTNEPSNERTDRLSSNWHLRNGIAFNEEFGETEVDLLKAKSSNDSVDSGSKSKDAAFVEMNAGVEIDAASAENDAEIDHDQGPSDAGADDRLRPQKNRRRRPTPAGFLFDAVSSGTTPLLPARAFHAKIHYKNNNEIKFRDKNVKSAESRNPKFSIKANNALFSLGNAATGFVNPAMQIGADDAAGSSKTPGEDIGAERTRPVSSASDAQISLEPSQRSVNFRDGPPDEWRQDSPVVGRKLATALATAKAKRPPFPSGGGVKPPEADAGSAPKPEEKKPETTPKPKPKAPPIDRGIIFFVILTFFIIISIMTVYFMYKRQGTLETRIGRMVFQEIERGVFLPVFPLESEIGEPHGENNLHGRIGIKVPSTLVPHFCPMKGSAMAEDHDPDWLSIEIDNDDGEDETLCVDWLGAAKLKIIHRNYGADSAPSFPRRRRSAGSSSSSSSSSSTGLMDCYEFIWQTEEDGIELRDCFNLTASHWYGGAITKSHKWPLNDVTIPVQKYVPAEPSEDHEFGSIMERYWLSSNGIALIVEDDNSLLVSVKDENLAKKKSKSAADSGGHHRRRRSSGHGSKGPQEPMEPESICIATRQSCSDPSVYKEPFAQLKYKICSTENLIKMHKIILNTHLNVTMARGEIDTSPLKDPVWSTAGLKGVTQDYVSDFAHNISTVHKLSHSVLEVTEGWQKKEGDMIFDSNRFPDVTGMVRDLKAKGFKTSLGVHVFANMESDALQEGYSKGYFVKAAHENVPALSKWRDGIAAVVDTTNDDALEWFYRPLRKTIRDNGFDSAFLFGGEASRLPFDSAFHDPRANPNDFTTRFVHHAKTFGGLAKVNSASAAQDVRVYLQLPSLCLSWQNLKETISTALTASFLGYPFVVPGAINDCHAPSSSSSSHPTLSRELYLRWLSLSAFFPVMQFSVAPWRFDPKSVVIARCMIEQHRHYAWPEAERLLRDWNATTPTSWRDSTSHLTFSLMKPLWFVAPDDEEALTIDDEFLLGDNTLIVPMVTPGTHRDIYLPKGFWRDQLRRISWVGPRTLYRYEIAEHEIAIFVKCEEIDCVTKRHPVCLDKKKRGEET